ncbi:Protein CBG24599 [Caenorhabditis briggsae]|uniref:Protein CBG24599 n=1 Tax=Caenorhabditis briggsae TaxID=6238 RepID=A8WL42_CAEBR|nr:Protein CBG24599 [Caenorhabditis briggsae]CAP21187.1 Protein CBG24599 [Caenorhabditis briggsae]
MLGSRSCAAHDPMDGISKRITGGSSSNGQAGEQPIWSVHGRCQQHRMMAGGRMLGNCRTHSFPTSENGNSHVRLQNSLPDSVFRERSQSCNRLPGHLGCIFTKEATTSATNLVRSRDAIGDQGTRPMAGRQMLGSRSCAAHDSSKRITGGSSSNGQAGEQPIWLDHGMCQQHRMMGGGRMLGNCAERSQSCNRLPGHLGCIFTKEATTSATNLVRSRDAIGDQGTRPMAGRQMLGSRSCAAHDSSKRITGGSSSNGQAGEQPIWLDHGMCQQHRMMGGGRMLGNCACAVQCYFFFFVKLIGVIKVKKY